MLLYIEQELKKLAQDLRIGIQETKARMNQQIAVPHTYEHEEYTGQDAYKQEEDSSGFKMESPSGANAFGGPGKIEHATTSMPMTLGGGVTPVSGMQGGQNGMQSMGGMGGVSGQMVGVSGQMIGVNTSGGAPSHGQFEIKQQ